MSVLEKIREVGIVPVVRATSSDQALAAVEAICAGGIPILEITLTVPGAIEIIRDLISRIDALIGAGTVLDATTGARSRGTTARFTNRRRDTISRSSIASAAAIRSRRD